MSVPVTVSLAPLFAPVANLVTKSRWCDVERGNHQKSCLKLNSSVCGVSCYGAKAIRGCLHSNVLAIKRIGVGYVVGLGIVDLLLLCSWPQDKPYLCALMSDQG